jgi:hypothetical protein
MGLVVFTSYGPKFASSVEKVKKYAKFKIILQKYTMFQNNFRQPPWPMKSKRGPVYNKKIYEQVLSVIGNGSQTWLPTSTTQRWLE